MKSCADAVRHCRGEARGSVVGALSGEERAEHKLSPCLGIGWLCNELAQVPFENTQRVYKQCVRERITTSRFDSLHGHRERLYACVQRQRYGRGQRELRMNEERVCARLGIEQRKALADAGIDNRR